MLKRCWISYLPGSSLHVGMSGWNSVQAMWPHPHDRALRPVSYESLRGGSERGGSRGGRGIAAVDKSNHNDNVIHLKSGNFCTLSYNCPAAMLLC